jgi:hypothetical protein
MLLSMCCHSTIASQRRDVMTLCAVGLRTGGQLTPGSRAGLEPRSGGKSVAVQPIVNQDQGPGDGEGVELGPF